MLIVKRGVHFLARGISGYANALDPERAVLSGGISNAGDFLRNMIIEELKPVLWRKDPEEFILFSKLGANMGLYGAGAVGAAKLEETI
jgi:glucokinase